MWHNFSYKNLLSLSLITQLSHKGHFLFEIIELIMNLH